MHTFPRPSLLPVGALLNPNRYLTTQEPETLEDGEPGLMPAFLKRLTDDFPLVPDLLPTLVPSSYNLWIGAR